MKKLSQFLLLAFIFIFSACSRDNENSENRADDLQSFLSGTFTVQQISYTGEVDFVTSIVPVLGIDTNAVGSYLFNSDASVTYSANGTVRFSPPAGSSPISVEIGLGNTNAPFSLINESTFSIQDETWGLMTYQVNARTSNSLTATTSLSSDTAGYSLDLRIDFSK